MRQWFGDWGSFPKLGYFDQMKDGDKTTGQQFERWGAIRTNKGISPCLHFSAFPTQKKGLLLWGPNVDQSYLWWCNLLISERTSFRMVSFPTPFYFFSMTLKTQLFSHLPIVGWPWANNLISLGLLPHLQNEGVWLNELQDSFRLWQSQSFNHPSNHSRHYDKNIELGQKTWVYVLVMILIYFLTTQPLQASVSSSGKWEQYFSSSPHCFNESPLKNFIVPHP